MIKPNLRPSRSEVDRELRDVEMLWRSPDENETAPVLDTSRRQVDQDIGHADHTTQRAKRKVAL